MDILLSNLPFLMKGFMNTGLLSIFCLLLSLAVGIVIGILSTMKKPIIVWLATFYTNVFRGLPIVVTLFLIFFTLPMIGVSINTFFSAMIGLSLWTSANIAEAVRGSILSIPYTQTEASYALGLNFYKTMRYVIIPQSLKRTLPSLIGLMTNLIQATSLTVLIGNMEFLKSAQILIERIEVMEGVPVAFVFYSFILFGYFVICYPLSLWSKKLESHLK